MMYQDWFLNRIFYQRFQCVDVCGKSFSSKGTYCVGRVGFLSNELFGNRDITHLLQGTQVTGKITIGDAELPLECNEVNLVIDHQHRHDSQSHPTFKCLVQRYDQVLHFSYLK